MTTHAYFHLTRLCGCNYRMPITRKGKSIVVTDPQDPGTRYRLNAAKFDAGERQYRDSWCIEPWTDKAARITDAEKDWQT